jgi:hypothetical protein
MVFKQCTSCKMDFGGAGVINVDGEIVRHDGSIRVDCLPKAISVFAPPSWEPPTVAEAAAGKAAGSVYSEVEVRSEAAVEMKMTPLASTTESVA